MEERKNIYDMRASYTTRSFAYMNLEGMGGVVYVAERD
jgi:hypothetical protein